jgi:hypothetical protein
MFENNEKDQSGCECNECERNIWATGSREVKIVYKKDKALCSLTSALKKGAER